MQSHNPNRSAEVIDFASILPVEPEEAEATVVLHDVGNLLNHVGINMEMLRREWSEPKALGALRSFIQNAESQPDLIRKTVEAGPERLVTYLRAILGRLESSHAQMDAQIGQLTGTLDDVRQLIRSQQGAARDAACARLVDVGALLDDVVELHLEAAFDARVSLRREGVNSLVMTVDRGRVLRILSNLVSNAMEAVSDQPTERRVVQVMLVTTDDGARFSVRDQGVGIDPAHFDSIFKRGFSTKISGHGFGLAGCSQAAEEMGGTLRFVSAGLGLGSTFDLCLPWKRHV